MIQARAIPCLLLKNAGLVKTVEFKKPQYIGDPLNAVRIYNEREVDELIFLDITATSEGREPDYLLIEQLAKECFMPFAYGGGIHSVEVIRKLLRLGVEKVVLNSVCLTNPQVVRDAVEAFGSSTIVCAADFKKGLFGKYSHIARPNKTSRNIQPVEYAKYLESLGAGELFINSVDRDGTMKGFDEALLAAITAEVSVPVIACGGAGSLNDIEKVVKNTAVSAVAAGSLFVYHSKTKGVLINYPSRQQLDKIFESQSL